MRKTTVHFTSQNVPVDIRLIILYNNKPVSWRKGGAEFWAKADRDIAQAQGGWRSSKQGQIIPGSSMLDTTYARIPLEAVVLATNKAALTASDVLFLTELCPVIDRIFSTGNPWQETWRLTTEATDVCTAICRSGKWLPQTLATRLFSLPRLNVKSECPLHSAFQWLNDNGKFVAKMQQVHTIVEERLKDFKCI